LAQPVSRLKRYLRLLLLATAKPDPINVTLLARPPRACVLVGQRSGFDWQTLFTAAIGAVTRLWGAPGNPLLPLPDTPAQCELFWALVALLDPDVYLHHQPHWDDLEELAPEIYGRQRAAIEKELTRIDADISFADEHLKLPIDPQGLPEELQRELVARTAPLHLDGDFMYTLLSSERAGIHPLTDASLLRPLPESVIEPAASIDPLERLLLATEFGTLSPQLRRDLAEAGTEVETRELPHRLELLRWIFGIGGPGWTSTPRRLGTQGLDWFQSVPMIEQKATIVVGEGPWDFALAYSLRCSGSLAWWLPESYLNDEGERQWVMQTLRSLTHKGFRLVVTSASDDTASERVASGLSSSHNRESQIQHRVWRNVLPLRPSRLLMRDLVGVPQPLHLQDGHTSRLNTPVPAFGEGTEELEVRWMTEVSVEDGWPHARHSALGGKMIDTLGSAMARTTADGIAYLGPGMFVRGGVPLALQATKPRLEPLSLLEQVTVIAEDSGWKCQLSEKGQYTIATAAFFKGFDGLCAALRREEIARVLTAYLDGGATAVGRGLKDRRRYLSRTDVDGLAGPGNEDVLTELTDLRLLVAGVVLKCSRCRYAAWYRPRDIDPIFSCTRCGAEHPIDSTTRLEHPEPSWRYRLDETVFQFLRHRGDLPALAASGGFASSSLTVGVVPELELFNPDGEKLEIDFVVADGGDVWIGEAFTGSKYGLKETKRLRKLHEATVMLKARGVVLATSARALGTLTQERAATVFPGPWPVWVERSSCELLPRPKKLVDALVEDT
jgi:hypothetical protein